MFICVSRDYSLLILVLNSLPRGKRAINMKAFIMEQRCKLALYGLFVAEKGMFILPSLKRALVVRGP